jgi:hypothetical protein
VTTRTAPGLPATQSDRASFAHGSDVTIDPSTAGFRALALQVWAMGLLDRRPGYYRLKIALTIFAFFAGWALFGMAGDSWAAIAVAPLLGIMFTQLGFIGHDAGHNHVFRLRSSGMHVLGIQRLARRRDRAAAVEASLILLHAALYLTVVLCVLSPLKALAFVAVQQGVFSVYLGISFAPNHKGMPVIESGTAAGFASRQVVTARNIRGGPLTSARSPVT